MKPIVRIVGILLIGIGLYWMGTRWLGLPSPGRLFRPSPVLIDETPVLITEIKQLANLVTIEASDEVAVGLVRPARGASAKKILEWISPAPIVTTDRLVLVVKGKLYAGTDLSAVDSSRIFIAGDSVSLQLPAAKILDIIVNPSDAEVFIEDGNWSQEETNQLVVSAREKLRQRATERGILNRADEQALMVLHEFLRLQGFNKIRILTQD